RLLAEGRIRDLKQFHDGCFEVRLKASPAGFARRLATLGCTTDIRDDMLLVRVPNGQSQQMIWQAAAAQREQIRFLRPQRSTLEEIFLKAVERP
ncbi:MAG TPA: hypothetical protein VKD72_34980, partial [Gemmataceae bacterium]|nr:hypothetical protein [Gemmataceae bacterium]